MLIDDIFYPEYRQIDLSQSVFLVGAFRTGSTSLHRQLYMDSGDDENKNSYRYISPYYFELFFPFLCVYSFYQKLQKYFGHERMQRICDNLLHRYFQDTLGPEVVLRHPMTGKEAEEDDLLLGSWYKLSWYSITGFPHPKAWKSSGEIHKFSSMEMQKVITFYERTMQKIMYHRICTTSNTNSSAPILLSKSHLIGLMPLLKSKYPKCKVVGLVRHPKNAFTSWYALSQAALDSIANKGRITPIDTAVASHFQFWDSFTQDEIRFFQRFIGNLSTKTVSDDGTVTVIRSTDYFLNHLETIETLYKNWHFPFTGTAFEKQLTQETKSHKSYQKKKGYTDPTLGDLGIQEEDISERYSKYISSFRLDK